MSIENKPKMKPLEYCRRDWNLDANISPEEAQERMTYKIAERIDTIKNCCCFFVILTVIGLLIALFVVPRMLSTLPK